MELSKAQTAVLKALLVAPLLTEHELAKAVSDATRRPQADVIVEIGKILQTLKFEGLVWAGQLFNKTRTAMWAAAITKGGREYMKHAGAPQP